MSSYREPADTPSRLSDELKAPLFDPDDSYGPSQDDKRQRRRLKQLLAGQVVVIVALVCYIILMSSIWQAKKNYWIRHELYSPARDAVRYETVVFDSGIASGRTKYQGYPTEENIKAWEDLYNAGVSIIPAEQAAKLPVPSRPHEKVPGYYTIQLDVFHELHCLAGLPTIINRIRMGLWGRESALLEPNNTETITNFNETSMSMDHLSHCIDAIRQSLMCNADISPVPWVWNSKLQKLRPVENSTHTCRDFEAIRLWAEERQAPTWNESVFVPDPLRGEV
ncbi:hypothetical protein N7456_011545 [Penicillium angulare]|uniref:Tat pathway signal sequence n=1 Tax=Penicillium angulare TaxID=116970 RepID=A0A9W9JZS5_9EURO|nr:hypothetical protein N7456_011545 [Penicillium angulare]